MNKDMLRKNLYARVRLRPIARRFNRTAELEQIDDDWIIRQVLDAGIRIENLRSYHTTILGYDHIHQYTSDPNRDSGGLKYGFLSLNVQILIYPSELRIEPIIRA